MTTTLLAFWRSLPVPVRRAAHRTLGAPGAAYRAVADRVDEMKKRHADNVALATALREAPRSDAPPALPVTIVGFHSAVHGLGEGARMLARGFADAGLPTRAIDLSSQVAFAADLAHTFLAPAEDERGVVISHINPPELMDWARRTEGRPLKGRRHIGYWAWELERPPSDWTPAFALVDEVWTPSAFATDAIRKIAPTRVKVSTVPYPLYLNPRPKADRERFGLPDKAVVVLMAFDLRSSAQRKNPQATLRAFQQARAAARRPAFLVCKVVGADRHPETFASLQAEVADDPSIRLMTENLSAEDMASLTASVDIVLSLHRSEGYGLLLAEAIWLGKPSLATGWSSNVEFMDPASSQLVDYTLIPVQGNDLIYRDGRWADADVDDAARKLTRMIDDEAWRAELAGATTRNRHVSFNRDTWLEMARGLLPSLSPLAP